MRTLEGKVAIVTGAGNGLGRAEAIELARLGAAVVVNDLGTSVDGGGSDVSTADAVVAEIVADGGRAIANHGDISRWTTAEELVEQAVAELGGLDIVVNNAGIVRRARIIDVAEGDVDKHMAVLFKGTFSVLRHAGRYWCDRHDAGDRRRRSVVNTSSSAGVPGGVEDFSLYGSMKAAVAQLTTSAALEWRGYGVNVNAILPHASTRMDSFAKGLSSHREDFDVECDPDDPRCTADVVSWLVSKHAAFITGQVFEISGSEVQHWRPWSRGGAVSSTTRWTPDRLADAMATEVFGTMPGGRTIPIQR